MRARGYRDGSESRRPYDPSRRVLACDACGAPIVAGSMASSSPCSACGDVLEVPEAPNLAVPRTPDDDPPARMARLREQLGDEPLMPPAVARFATVLPDDLPDARRLWGSIRKRAAADPHDLERAEELMTLALTIQSALPLETDDDHLVVRALVASTAEALGAPEQRQRALSLLASSAIRAGHADDGKVWLAEMDPASRDLRAATVHATSVATFATATSDWQAVLGALGATVDDGVVHRSSRALAGVLRANALEKAGDVAAAARELEKAMRERPSGLAVAKSIVARTPKAWRTCERSLPIAGAAVRSGLAAHIPLGARARLGWLAVPGLLGVIFGLATGATAFAAVSAAAIALGIGAFVSDGWRRERIAQESERVSGRILGARDIDDETVELELHIEREAGDVTIKTKQPWGQKLREQSLEGYVGCTFVGFWHPGHPTVVPQITIQRAADGEVPTRKQRQERKN